MTEDTEDESTELGLL